MTAPKICEYCGACLDAGETCDCQKNEENTKTKTNLVNIKIEHIHPHPENPRKDLGDLSELSESIKKNGIMQNLTVIPGHFEGGEMKSGDYTLIIGHRRCGAAKLAGIEEVPCRVVEGMNRKEQVSTMLEENMQRNDLTIYEQAWGFQMMLDLGETESTIAQKTGFSKTTIRHRLNIAKLDQKLVKEKELDEGFQLSLKDLYALEQVKDINTRNKILNEALNSRDLIWKAESASREEKRKKKEIAIIKMLEDIGVKPAPKKVENEWYSDKWEKIKEISLDKDVPDSISLDEKEQTFYFRRFDRMAILKKKKKEPRQKSEWEIERDNIKKKQKWLKDKVKNMAAVQTDFIKSILSGKVKPLKDESEVLKLLWKILLENGTWYSEHYSFFLEKDEYDCSAEEKEAAKEKVRELDVIRQMMLAMPYITKKTEIIDFRGERREIKTNTLSDIYKVFEPYGLTLSEEEKKLINGTHEIYEERE